MTSARGARIAMIAGAATLVALSFSTPVVAWPSLLTASLVLSVAGVAAASSTLPVARVAGVALLLAGWFLRFHLDAGFDGLPASPLLGRWFDLSPVLGIALGAAGLQALTSGGDATAARRLAGLGAVLLLSAALLPETEAGSLTVPLLAAMTSPGLPLLLVVALGAAGLLLAIGLFTRQAIIRPVILLGLIPAWLCLSLAFKTALFSVAEAVVLAGGFLLIAGEGRRQVAVEAEAAAVVLMASVWWLLKIHGLGYAGTDEYIYFYAAKSWADGLWPYRDFFFSHPPVHIAIPAVVFKLFGFHHLLAKLLAPAMLFAAGLVVWRGARRHFGPVAGVASLAAFWFASEVLKSSTTFTGVETTTLFLALGIVGALDRRSFRAGLWFGLATCTGIYGLAGFLTFGVLAFFAPRRRPRDATRMAAGFLLVFGLINLVFLGIAGGRYIDGVYRYHLLKPMKDPDEGAITSNPLALVSNFFVLLGGRDFRATLYYHAAHYWLALLAVAALVRRRGSGGRPALPAPGEWWPARPGGTNPDGAIVLLTLSALGTLVELGSLKERYDFYFTLLFPALSLLAGTAVSGIVRLCDQALAPPPAPAVRRGKAAGDPARRRWAAPAGALVLAALWVPIDSWANLTAFPEEGLPQGSSKGAGEVLRFEWTPSPVLPSLGEVAHALFWSDTRVRGELQPGIRHFLWTKKRTFESAPAIAEYIDEHTSAEDTITGASDFTPLVALLAHRRLAGNQVDTNTKVFSTGIVSEEEFWRKTCADRPAYIVSTAMSWFAPDVLPSHLVAGSSFREETRFEDHGLKQWHAFPIELWRRVRDPPETICAL